MGNKYEVIDADCHILEPPHIWETWLPKEFQEKAPKLVKDADGGDGWLFAGATDPDPIGLTSTPGMAFDQFRWTGVTYDEARSGCYIGSDRLKDMDIDGVDAEVLFAPQRTIGHFLGDDDDDFVLAGIDAYNNFLREEFCAPDPTRLIAVGQLPSTGVDDTVAYAKKLKDQGFKAVAMSNWPAGGETISDEDDAFWAAAQDLDLPVCIHINVISRSTRAKQRKAAQAAAKAGEGTLYGGKAAKANAKAVGGLAGVFSTVPSTMSQLIFTGVFERFPNLHVTMIETGVGWMPHFLEMADDKYWRNRSWGNIPLSEPPSYYWYRNMSATFIVDRSGINQRHAVGVDNMMWSSDYPHHGNDWPYSRKTINEMMGTIDRAEQAKIVCGNAQRIFKLEG
jgi:predicted TIM-barrel fold metal-dependent hydrolase